LKEEPAIPSTQGNPHKGLLKKLSGGQKTRDIRVLVVDDMQVVGDLFKRLLGEKSYSVIVAGSGEEALAKLKKEHFDMIFLDIVMPGMDGVETLKAIKKVSPQTPVVMMTGYALEDKIEESLKLGAFNCLRKPFEITDVIDAINKVLENNETSR